MLQTHISYLFFAGTRVYKVKKPVRFDFLDYGTLERRRHFCEEEVRLNRRLAPEVYLGVVPIDASFLVGGPGEPVEYAVEMVRLPAERMMDRLLERGEIDDDAIRRLVDLLARFHSAAPVDAEFGAPDEVRRIVQDNLDQARRFLPATLHAHLEAGQHAFLEANRALLERRVEQGWIRDGHGDLHSGNICMLDSGIVVYDCIEFSRSFRCCDVAADLAFLAMDLDLRRLRGFSSVLVKFYAERTDDPELASLLDFYKVNRACIRGVVGGLLSNDEHIDAQEREAARLGALGYFHLAISYRLPPALILTCGLPATGKSTLARHLAAPFEAVVLRSDLVRKRLAGIPPTRHWEGGFFEGPYRPEITEQTHAALLDDAKRHLAGGRTVVVDATFARREWRRRFRELGSPCLVVHLDASEAVVKERMEKRRADRGEVSDADYAVYRQARQHFEPPRDALAHDGVGPPADLTTRVLEALVATR